MISRAFQVLITRGSASVLALGRPYGLGICCIYIEKHIYIIDTMLHKKGEKGASAAGSYIKQSVSNKRCPSLRAGDGER